MPYFPEGPGSRKGSRSIADPRTTASAGKSQTFQDASGLNSFIPMATSLEAKLPAPTIHTEFPFVESVMAVTSLPGSVKRER